MADKNTVEVNILDKPYMIACPDEAKNQLVQAARHLDQKMREIRNSGKVYGAERIAVMAALNITYEMQQGSRLTSELDHLFEKVDKQLDDALAKLP